MKLKIVSDGTYDNLHVLNAQTGEELEGVTKATITWEEHDIPRCTLTLCGIEVIMLADLPEDKEAQDIALWDEN